jgi:hypothetical protein
MAFGQRQKGIDVEQSIVYVYVHGLHLNAHRANPSLPQQITSAVLCKPATSFTDTPMPTATTLCIFKVDHEQTHEH